MAFALDDEPITQTEPAREPRERCPCDARTDDENVHRLLFSSRRPR
jgi:hypothetical protein